MLWSTRHSFCFNGQCEKKEKSLHLTDGKVAANVDSYAPVVLNGEHHQATVRMRHVNWLESLRSACHANHNVMH